MNEQSLFLRAIEQPAGEPRRVWLEQECEDLAQRTRIAALLERHERAGSFLERPPEELRGTDPADSSVKAKPITKSKFVERLIRSRLMTADEAAECESSLESLQAAPDALSYAHAMVKANKLTGFQAKAVCDGRIKGLTFGEYIILDRLGKGGMGIVYRAKHRRMDRLVAIKVLPRSTMATKGLADRFYHEVKTAAKLMHPNIVAALDASEDDGLHYLVMEYVDGQDLREVLRQTGPLPPGHAVNCIIQAARGLQYAHEQGVIHRDIKPANLLIDGNGTVKVLDMGLARFTGAAGEPSDESAGANTLSWDQDSATISDQTRLTRDGEIMGTLDYMPPEQFTDSRHVDERGDIYSLGCTLYRLLTDQKPYSADTVGAIFQSHRSDPIPTLRSVRPEIPEHLDRVFQRMLAKQPEQRQRSMLQVIEELEQSLAAMQSNSAGSQQIVLSHDPPVRRRRRSRLGWIPATVAACSLLMTGVSIFVQRYGQSESSVASSGSPNSLVDANSTPQGGRMTAVQNPQGNTNAKLPVNGEEVDDKSHREPDIGVGLPQPTSPVESPGKADFENGEPRPIGEAAGEITAESEPPESEGNQNEVDTRVEKPTDQIGGTSWPRGFVFQGGSTFGPSANRQVAFSDNGRRVSISENATGITVTVDGKVVEAANRAELRQKDAQAFQLYDKVFGKNDVERVPGTSAFDLQRTQLEGLREMHSGNPQMKALIESMMPRLSGDRD